MSRAISSVASHGVSQPISWPSIRLTVWMMSKSVRAPPGGSIAASTAWKRRSALVNVPSFSRNAEAGRITSAYLVVSFSKISWQTTNSRFSSAAVTCAVSGSVCATSSPKMYIAFRSPATAWSNISGIL